LARQNLGTHEGGWKNCVFLQVLRRVRVQAIGNGLILVDSGREGGIVHERREKKPTGADWLPKERRGLAKKRRVIPLGRPTKEAERNLLHLRRGRQGWPKVPKSAGSVYTKGWDGARWGEKWIANLLRNGALPQGKELCQKIE